MAVKQNREPSSLAEGQILERIGESQSEPGKRRTIPILSRLNSIAALRSWKIRLGLGILGFFVLLAIFAPLIAQQNPQTFSNDSLAAPSPQHLLGTTQVGQDVFAQLVYGTRVTLLVGFSVGIIATTLAVVIGLAAGFFGGVLDDVLSMFMNIFLLIPAVPLAIVLGGYLTVRGPIPVTVVLVITGWAFGARVLRAQTLSMRKRDFVEAARASGETTARIIFSEILPNELGIIFSGLIFTVLYAILAEIGLEFLGLSDITVISWGNILFWAGNQNALLVGAWWWFVPPGVCIALVGASLALVNFGMDEIINPRLRDASRG
ncbi:MAG TPA: ABC transporter permease [Ktedonobacterales bacterium]|nr:ABC transporter permease [Ktedonobacterales bacterium]